jgi:hypothetical protein
MTVERRVVAAVVIAGVAVIVVAGLAAVLRWRRLLAALAGGPTAGPLPRVTEAWRRRLVPVILAGVL